MLLIHWVEIPTTDIERAKAFYCKVFAIDMQIMEAMGMKTAFFPHDATSQFGGCLMQGTGYIPSKLGSIVYFKGGNDLQVVLDRVQSAGGEVLLPKTSLGQNGFMAHFMDTEGNRIGIHYPE